MTVQIARFIFGSGLAGLFVLFAQVASAAPAAGEAVSKTLIVTSDVLSDSALEKTGVTIGAIRIDNRDVFDTSVEGESGALYRFANVLHIQTRADVIRQQLLLHEGDPFEARTIEESERMLRSNAYLSTADIHPVRLDGNTVDIDVITEDTWSLAPSLKFSRKGGKNTGGAELSDSNIFGTGAEIKLGYRSGFERDELFFGYHDPQLGESRTELLLGYADTSDGEVHELAVRQPFYSLDAQRAGGIGIRGFDQVDSLYSFGEVDREVSHTAEYVEAFYGWSDGLRNGATSRWTTGVAYDAHSFPGPDGMPARDGRRDIYPFLGYEWIEDAYETTRNADNLQIVEDRHVGMHFAGRIGYASDAWGAHDNAWIGSFAIGRGFRVLGDDMLLASLEGSGRFAADQPRQSLVEGRLRYYHRQSPMRLFYGEVSLVSGQNLDSDQQLTLGGENGLRGYPVRYLNGELMTLATLEQRFYTNWYPFHLFRVGAAVFFDAAKVLRSGSDLPGFTGWHRDVGVGLRIGSPRSSTGRMLHLDYACPFDAQPDRQQCQVIIETRHSF
ncbi:MAG: BamA/TamA family outer membrane protein [Woeseiaceae bacterium]